MNTNSGKVYESLKICFYPDVAQNELLLITFGCCRKIYNEHINEIAAFYEKFILPIKQESTEDELNKIWGTFKPKSVKDYVAIYDFMDVVSPVALRQAMIDSNEDFYNLNKSLMNKNSKIELPKRKTKKELVQSYKETSPKKEDIDLKNRKLILPKIGVVEIEEIILPPWYNDNCILKSITISKSELNKYFASLLFELN